MPTTFPNTSHSGRSWTHLASQVSGEVGAAGGTGRQAQLKTGAISLRKITLGTSSPDVLHNKPQISGCRAGKSVDDHPYANHAGFVGKDLLIKF